MTLPDTEKIAALLLLRRRARASLVEYARSIPIPGAPSGEEDSFGDILFRPVELDIALHHRLILQAIQELWEARLGDGCTNLMIFAPPGSGKSTYASVVAPTWMMGVSPGTRVILVSHGSSIAAKQSRRARSVARSKEFQSIFQTTIPKDQTAADDWALENTSQMMAAGVGAGITGNRAEVLILDDVVKNFTEASSDAIQDGVWHAYLNDLRTRLVPKSIKLLIMTRWSPNDLAGRILPSDYDWGSGIYRGRDGERWRVLNFMAECEREDDPLGRKIGEFIWPEWFPPEFFRRIRDSADVDGQRTWSALYQQRPAPLEGLEFKYEDFRWYDSLEDKEFHTYGSSDYAVTDGSGDFTEHAVWKVDDDGNLYAVDWWYGKTDTHVSADAFVDLLVKHRPMEWFGEKGVIENAIGPTLDMKMREARRFVTRTLLPVSRQGNKSARLAAFRARVKAGKVFFPRDTPWAARVVRQLMSFPASPDDAADACGLMGRALAEVIPPVTPKPSQKGRKVILLMDEMLARYRRNDRIEALRKQDYLS